jgi:hypothetical protein
MSMEDHERAVAGMDGVAQELQKTRPDLAVLQSIRDDCARTMDPASPPPEQETMVDSLINPNDPSDQCLHNGLQTLSDAENERLESPSS